MRTVEIRSVIQVLLLTAFLFGLAACAVDPVTGRTELMLISEEQEVQLGRQTDQTVTQEYGVPRGTYYHPVDRGKEAEFKARLEALTEHDAATEANADDITLQDSQ